MISRELIQAILQQYPLNPLGIHGVVHWARVLENGRRLSMQTQANLAVVELFSIFHDARRESDGVDFKHGEQGARLAVQWRGRFYDLPDDQLNLLVTACERHTFGKTQADVTVQTCWDADRLDLGRVGIVPSPKRLCTSAARDPEMIAWAEQRARSGFVPELLCSEWGYCDTLTR